MTKPVELKVYLRSGPVVTLVVQKPDQAQKFFDGWTNAVNHGSDNSTVGFDGEFSVRVGDVVAIGMEEQR